MSSLSARDTLLQEAVLRSYQLLSYTMGTASISTDTAWLGVVKPPYKKSLPSDEEDQGAAAEFGFSLSSQRRRPESKTIRSLLPTCEEKENHLHLAPRTASPPLPEIGSQQSPASHLCL